MSKKKGVSNRDLEEELKEMGYKVFSGSVYYEGCFVSVTMSHEEFKKFLSSIESDKKIIFKHYEKRTHGDLKHVTITYYYFLGGKVIIKTVYSYDFKKV